MKTFIKKNWYYVVALIFTLVVTVYNFIAGDLSAGFWSLSVLIWTFLATLNKYAYDDLWEDHSQLIVDYVNELNSNLDFIKSAKTKLADIMLDVEEVKQESKKKPVAKKKPAAKKLNNESN